MTCAILYYSFMRVIIDLMLLQIALLNPNRFNFLLLVYWSGSEFCVTTVGFVFVMKAWLKHAAVVLTN